VSLRKPATARSQPAPGDVPPPAANGPSPGPLGRARTTQILLGVLCALAVVLALEATIIAVAKVSAPETSAVSEQPGVVEVPEDQPVLIDELQYRDGVESAARAAQEIVA